MTSADVVYWLRRELKLKKIGHTGTLDPGVAGVLPVCLGQATRLAEYLTNQGKGYRAEMTLGICTTTQDGYGETLQSVQPNLKEEDVQAVLPEFTGGIEQLPPMFSAVRKDGKHLYEYARAGVEVERKVRSAHIYSIVLKKWLAEDFPRAMMDIECSKGTYIRTICHDIGQRLGCGAYMSYLVRWRSGPFKLEESWTLEEIKSAVGQGDRSFLLGAEKGLDLPVVQLPASRVQAFCRGLATKSEYFNAPEPAAAAHVQVRHEDELLGIGIWRQQQLYPHKVIKKM
jgi:tRNA pseudouridine55 synthase